MLHGYRSEHDVCCNKCTVLQLSRSRARNTRSAWTEESWRRIARVKARTVSRHAEPNIDVRIAFAFAISSKRNYKSSDFDRYIGKYNAAFEGARRRCARPACAGKICADVCRITSSSCCEMKKRECRRIVRLIVKNRHALYVGHGIKHACVVNITLE